MAEQEARQNVRHKGNDKSDIVGNNLNQEKKKEALRKQQESTGNTISEHRREQLHEENEELPKDHGASSPVTLPLPGSMSDLGARPKIRAPQDDPTLETSTDNMKNIDAQQQNQPQGSEDDPFSIHEVKKLLRNYIHLLTRDQSSVTEKELKSARVKIKEELNEYTDIPIKIAVIGQSGSGKSAFINATRNIMDWTSEDAAKVGVVKTTNEITAYPHLRYAARSIIDWTSKDAAKVGVVKTTKEITAFPHPIKTITAYPHPRYTNLVYYDLPGVNTPRFPRKLYLNFINLYEYDFFVLVSSDEFTDDDGWLAKELEDRRKPFYFVRTKIDSDIRNNLMMKKSQSETLNDIRNDCKQDLLQILSTRIYPTSRIPGIPIFLVNNENPMAFDFPEFQSKMTQDAPKEKRKALISSIASFSPIMIGLKRKNMKGRIRRLSILRAITFLPVQSHEHAPFIEQTLDDFKTQLGIDTKSTQAMKELCGVVLEELQTDSCVTSELLARCEEDVKTFMAKRTFANIIELFPLLGTSVGCIAEVFVWHKFFNELLNLCVQEAGLLHKAVADALSDRENHPL